MTTTESTARRVTRSRVVLGATAASRAAGDLGLKALAKHNLAGWQLADLGVMQLRVAHSGVAFGLGASVPSWVVLSVAGLITASLAVYAWRRAPTLGLPGALSLAAVLAGAVANLIDRGLDRVVTDYLHTGWWSTFNLVDVFITGGVALLFPATRPPSSGQAHEQDPKPAE